MTFFQAQFKRRILHATSLIAELSACKMRRLNQLRTVSTFVSAHTFCASRKTWFECALGLTLTQLTTLLMKAKFSYRDQIKFNQKCLRSFSGPNFAS